MNFVRPEIDPDLEELIPDFIENTINDYKAFESSYNDKNFEGMRKVCHTVLGTAQSYGFTQLDTIVTKLQDNAKEESLSDLQENFVTFQNYIEFLKKEFPL